jgi:hypothetical protein
MNEKMNNLPLVPRGAKFEFGMSPFKTKGVLYIGTRTFFEKKVPGGFKALTDQIGPGPLCDFVSQKFLPAIWYDVMPAQLLINYEAATLGLSFEQYLKERTLWQVGQDVGGIYRFLLKLTSPRFLVGRLPILMAQMFDFCDLEVREVDDHTREAYFKGIPVQLVDWLRISLGLYTENIMSRAGAKTVEVDYLKLQPEEPRAGLNRVTMGFRIHWT